MTVEVATAAGHEAILEGRRATVVQERRAAADTDEARHLELATGADIDELEVRPDGEFDFTLRKGWTQYS